MTDIQSTQTPLGRFVLFCVSLAIAGCILAGTYYFTVDLPQQKSVSAPENADCFTACEDQYNKCLDQCRPSCTISEKIMCAETLNTCSNGCV